MGVEQRIKVRRDWKLGLALALDTDTCSGWKERRREQICGNGGDGAQSPFNYDRGRVTVKEEKIPRKGT